MTRRYVRKKRRSTTTYPRRRRNTTRRDRRLDSITLGARVGGVAGLALLVYGLLGVGMPGPAADLLAPGFALSVGVALVIVAIALHFSAQAGWFDINNSRPSTSTTRARRRNVRRYR